MDNFNSPPRVFALAMLNSSLTDEEIIPFLDGLKEAGYQGICLHPRDGLLVPYASRLYWKKIDHIIALARERGFEIWHYDEYPYPSGIAGGMLTADDSSLAVQGLHFEEVDLTPNRNGLIEVGDEPLLALLRYRENELGEKVNVRDVTADCGSILDTWAWGEWHNLNYTGALNIDKEVHERAVSGRYIRVFASEEPLREGEKLLAVKLAISPGKANTPGLPDVTRPEVTDRFLEKIYSQLAELSEKHGLVNTPVFQDEVAFGAAWPWNREIAGRLKPVWGEDWRVKLAGLHAPNVAGWEQTRAEYRAATQDAFEQNWCVRVRDYCHANNLQVTGHFAGEESIYGHCQLLGNIFKNLRHLDIPGYDIISSTISNDINRSQQTGIKLVQSAAWLDGRKPTMVEVFGAHGHHSDLQRQRNVLAWLGLHDFSLIFDHSAYGSAQGIRKYDAPPVSTRFNPLVAGRPDLWNWHNWFADLMQEYVFTPRTLVLFPVESLARYSVGEIELWREEVSLLETWFHYVCAASLDVIFLPSHLLDQIEVHDDGFHLQGHVFDHFVVPPVASLQQETWEKVVELSGHPGFAWSPAKSPTVTVFGEEVDSHTEFVPGERVFVCDEAELISRKAGFFDDMLQSTLREFATDVTLLKTVRRNAQSEELIVLLNTHDKAVPVECEHVPGTAIVQPPQDIAGSSYVDGIIEMQPREVLIFRSEAPGVAEASIPSEKLLPISSHFQITAPNFLKLENGIMRLDEWGETAFAPQPVSASWQMPGLPYKGSPEVKLFWPPYSLAPLPHPLQFEAEFNVSLEENLTNLGVLLDDDSAPRDVIATWSGQVIAPRKADILDQGNTLYQIPAALLTAGVHQLKFVGTLSKASEGILERPILHGDFVCEEAGKLRAAPAGQVEWQGETWLQLGIPEGFGPHEYEFLFELNDEQAKDNWNLHLQLNTGVAQAWINETDCGKSSWAPRLIPAQGLIAGQNNVRVQVHGSWNNVYSCLNFQENGLIGSVTLKK
jgi:hypothetical protein